MSTITLPVAELRPALAGLGKVIRKRASLPVLGCVHIERASNQSVTLTGTDLDTFVSLRLELPGQPVADPLSVLVPYEELQASVKASARDDSITVAPIGENRVAIEYRIGEHTTGRRCDAPKPDEFPAVPVIAGDAAPLPEEARRSLHQAFECASEDSTRLILNGAYLDVGDRKCHHVVATDGRHLFGSNSFRLPLAESVILPSHRFLGAKEFNTDGEWSITVERAAKQQEAPHVEIRTRRWRFITRQHEGNYPNWRHILPKDFNTTMEFEAGKLEAIVEAVQRLPDHDPVNHAIGVDITGSSVSLLAKTEPEATWTPLEFGAAKITGKAIRLFLNRRLLVKALRFGLSRLEIVDEMSPVRFKHEGRFLVIQPVRYDSGSIAIAKDPSPPPERTAVTVNSPPHQAEQRKEGTMPKENAPGAGKTAATPEKSAVECALAQIDVVRGDFRDALAGLNKLADHLKQVQRENKASEREIQSVRATLRSLQSVRI